MFKARIALAILVGISSPAVFATNGMNMEGYGPISTAMGGTAVAFDNGIVGVMTNPATVGLDMTEGSLFQVAIGNLRPEVSASAGSNSVDSGGTSYLLPGLGYITKKDGFTYGISVMAQGGMGTEYDKNSFVALGTGENVRSEVSVGRVVVPLSYQVNDKLTLGMSIDFVWAGMDIKMAVPGAGFLSSDNGGLVNASRSDGAFAQFVSGADAALIPGSGGSVDPVTGALTLPNGMGGAGPTINTGRFDFSNDDDFTGEAKGTGFGFKLGAVYKLNEQLTLGISYAAKTNLESFDTNNAVVSIQVEGFGSVPIQGDLEIKDFQWPAVTTVGLAYTPSEQWLLTADIEYMGWKDTMKAFKMDFVANDAETNAIPGFGDFRGSTLAVELPQNWDNQIIYMLGAQYSVNEKLDLRAGMNISDNPVPNEFLNALFPAIVEKHYTAGFGYQVTKASGVDFSFTYAPEATETSANGVVSTHGQTVWQAMYSYAF